MARESHLRPVLLVALLGMFLVALALMSDADDAAMFGEDAGYVPCNEAASALPAPDDDENAISGRDAGYAVSGDTASAFPANDDDSVAVGGSDVGFVAKPCVDCTRVSPSFFYNDMDIGPAATSWKADRTARTGPGTVIHQTSAQQTSSSFRGHGYGTPTHTDFETRYLASIHVGTIPTATHYRLTATLRNGTLFIFDADHAGNIEPVHWELVAGNWGTGTPVWDTGTVVAAGIIPPSTYIWDSLGIDAAIPVVSLPIVVTWPITGPYAQWYFRNVSPTVYRRSAATAPPFSEPISDLRYPLDTISNVGVAYLDPASAILQEPDDSSAFEDWTLDVMHCA